MINRTINPIRHTRKRLHREPAWTRITIMLRTLLNVALLPIALAATSCQTAPRHVAGLESVECIWREAPHNAFTDLLVVNDRLLCTFREGDDHVHGRWHRTQARRSCPRLG